MFSEQGSGTVSVRNSRVGFLFVAAMLAACAADSTTGSGSDATRIDSSGAGDLSVAPLPDVPELINDTIEDVTGDTTEDVTGDTTEDVTGDFPADVGDGSISIYLTGDSSERAYDDDLAGQTPRGYTLALGDYFIQTSLDDSSPQLCFGADGAAILADLAADNLMGACPTAMIPSAIYTHGRVNVAWVRYTVDGSLHHLGVPYPGEFEFFRAYSDTTFEGDDYSAGEGYAEFHGITNVRVPLVFDDPVEFRGTRVETTNGRFWMTFPYTEPLPVVQSNTDAHWARMHWHIFEAFRWEDVSALGYVDGVWDISSIAPTVEEVVVPGVSGYHITTSLDGGD